MSQITYRSVSTSRSTEAVEGFPYTPTCKTFSLYTTVPQATQVTGLLSNQNAEVI